METEDLLRNKTLYKILLILLKYIPIIIGIGYMLNTLLLLFGINLVFLSFFIGISLLPWLFLYISSFVFKFCSYHRAFLYYVLAIDGINWIDYTIGIPVTSAALISIELVIAGITLILALWLYVKHRKKLIGSNT